MTLRETREHELMKQDNSFSPITVADAPRFSLFGEYKHTFAYHSQAVNGWSPYGESPFRHGLKFYDGTNLASIGFYNRREKGSFVVIPSECDDRILIELVELLSQLSQTPVYLKKVSVHQSESLRHNPAIRTVDQTTTWFPNAQFEDDTFPEIVISLDRLATELTKGRNKSNLKNHFVQGERLYSGRMEIRDYHPERDYSHAMELLLSFFSTPEVLAKHLSVPEDYFNFLLLDPQEIRSRSSLYLIDGTPAGFFFASEDVGEQTMNVYANIALRSFKALAEFLLLTEFQRAHSQGFTKANLGGSETKGLDTFKRKFKPVETREHVWLVYNRNF